MGKFLAGIIIGGVILFVYQHATRAVPAHEPLPVAAETPEPEVLPAVEREETQFRCDGRNYCSQMTSCEEATWFIEHCSGAEMDGDGDGVPCEKQWCRRL
jgi:Excalibur calcium-binding domain